LKNKHFCKKGRTYR